MALGSRLIPTCRYWPLSTYLGFYVYGVILGIFSPMQLYGFTIIAMVCAAAFIVHLVRIRRAMKTPGGHEAMMREAHVHREHRGF
jgi:hypothetical protein